MLEGEIFWDDEDMFNKNQGFLYIMEEQQELILSLNLFSETLTGSQQSNL